MEDAHRDTIHGRIGKCHCLCETEGAFPSSVDGFISVRSFDQDHPLVAKLATSTAVDEAVFGKGVHDLDRGFIKNILHFILTIK